MIDFSKFRSLEETLAHAMRHPAGLQELASLNEITIQATSQLAVDEDWYGDMHLIKTAIKEVWKIKMPYSFIAHSIWCAHREAQWLLKTDKFEETNLSYHFHQPEYFIQTQNKPTIIITPMTLGTYDAIHIVLTAINRFQPQRQVVFYGEHMESYLELHPEHKKLFTQNTSAGIKQILQTLHSGGIFLTYPDFVYKEHAVIHGELFGIKRSFSSSFLKIALKSEVELLPVTINKINDSLHMKFYSPISADNSNDYKQLPDSIRMQLQSLLVSKILEGLIVQVPNQWRLLTTLTHDSKEMA